MGKAKTELTSSVILFVAPAVWKLNLDKQIFLRIIIHRYWVLTTMDNLGQYYHAGLLFCTKRKKNDERIGVINQRKRSFNGNNSSKSLSGET